MQKPRWPDGIEVLARGARGYAAAKDELLRRTQALCRNIKTSDYVPKRYVVHLFEEEEDRIDYIVLLRERQVVEGFALLSKKILARWVPPEWTWQYADDIVDARKKDADYETLYVNQRTGKRVYDDLNAVWKGRDESDPDIFAVQSVHIHAICAQRTKGRILMEAIDDIARTLRIRTVSLGAIVARPSCGTLGRVRASSIDVHEPLGVPCANRPLALLQSDASPVWMSGPR